LADSYFHSGSLERIAHLALRDRFAGHHSARRTSSAHVGGYRHLPVVEIDSMGIGHDYYLCLGGFGIARATHYGRADNPTVAAFSKLPVWLLVFIVFRAGVAEELFYRGYAIERIESLGLNRFLAVVIPLTIFGVVHWTGGWANILIALALGVILSVFYVWRRDLVANMIAHFLVDFIGNIH
jgi:Type II CAAX prenyl endopeptidase Rce1-like